MSGRIAFQLRRPTLDLCPAPERRAFAGRVSAFAAREPSLISATRLRFLGVERDLDAIGWDHVAVPRLWRYNLHYFDDLNARDSARRHVWQRALIDRWITENPPTRGTGWEPYPVSLRIVNWVKWLAAGAEPAPGWLDSLAVQTRWLRHRLEKHLLGNHLFANGKALVHAGLLFRGDEATEWFECGAAIIRSEIDEQFLADGGQFERSPMYHALALEDLLDLINICRAAAPGIAAVDDLVRRMKARATGALRWLRFMVHPSGQLALFNDCSDGVAPSFAELERYATRLGIPAVAEQTDDGIQHLDASGYLRVRRGTMTALLDVAPIGPDYLPGHAHADTLSFELSLGESRVLANGGTSLYEPGARRVHERSTAAHNTVEVSGHNSSEVWASFRVGRRARPIGLEISDWHVVCAHDGYRFLPGEPIHRRRWQFEVQGLVIEDEVVPAMQACARFYAAPGLRFQRNGGSGSTWSLRRGDRLVAVAEIEVGSARCCPCEQAQEFGAVAIVDCLVVDLVAGRARTSWSWRQDAHPVSN